MLYLPEFSRILSSKLGQTDWAGCVDTDIMTIPEVAEYLKLTEKTAYRLAAEGKIPGFKIGGSWRFRKADIDEWIELQKKEKKN